MTTAERTIEVIPGSELDRLIEEAEGITLVLVKAGASVTPEETENDIWANYDPERVKRALRASAGAVSHIDTEALKAEIRALREYEDDCSE